MILCFAMSTDLPTEDADYEEGNPLLVSRPDQAYQATHHGTLGHYIAVCKSRSLFPVFYGIEQFEMLKQSGWLRPGMSYIRLMWNSERGDEHFLVTEDGKLEGVELNRHSGREGIHEPAHILKGAPPFEAQHLYDPVRFPVEAVRVDIGKVLGKDIVKEERQ